MPAYMQRRGERLSWRVLQPAMLWSVCFGALGLALGLVLVGPQNVWSIIYPHVAAPTTDWLQGGAYTINNRLRDAVPILILGFLGTLLAVYKRSRLSLYPLAWGLLAYTLFSFYSPVFYHHQLLVTAPAAMLGAAAAAEGLGALVRIRAPSDIARLPTFVGLLALVAFIWASTQYAPELDRELMNSPRLSGFSLRATGGKLKVIRTMQEYADQTNWILTDMPMYAFRVQRPVPPILATFSSKRLATGSLTEEDILTAMRDYRPEQVLMARFDIPALEHYIEQNYTLILSAEYFRLFIRNDLKPISD